MRSRKILTREVGLPLVADGFAQDDVIAVVGALKSRLLGESKKAKAAKADKKAKASGPEPDAKDTLEAALDTNQVIVLGRPEIDFIHATARKLLEQHPNDAAAAVEALLKQKEVADNLHALRLAAGLDAALFGRMVTSDILARGDGAVHVAHALTVHAEESEPDYFIAIDDLTREAGELGTGLIQTAELTSGLYYGYVVIDVPQLVSNLEGVEAAAWRGADRRLAAAVVERLVALIAAISRMRCLPGCSALPRPGPSTSRRSPRPVRTISTCWPMPVPGMAACARWPSRPGRAFRMPLIGITPAASRCRR